jgi:hypothetical protein
VFLFFQLSFDFFHLFAHAFVRGHCETFFEAFRAEDEEEHCCSKCREAFGKNCRECVAQDRREDGHDYKSAKCGAEYQDASVTHCHQGGYEESFVADL